MLRDRRPLLTRWADKVAVRDYVAARVGVEYLTELLLVTEDPDAVRAESLPREFVLKAAHGSGGCVIVGDHVPPDVRLPEPPVGWARLQVSPTSLDWHRLRECCREWLSLRYDPYEEWAYRHVRPRIFAEELLLDGGSVPADHRFFVFHGRVRLIQVSMGRFHEVTQNFYSLDWEPLEMEHSDLRPGPRVERPPALEEMIRVAEALGGETDFVRVDLYPVGGRIVFGELTSYPWGGSGRFRPPSVEYELGSWWSLPEGYR